MGHQKHLFKSKHTENPVKKKVLRALGEI